MSGDFEEEMDELWELEQLERDEEEYRRSRGGTGGGHEGCYIATAVYGSYDCPEVLVLRKFRDDVLKRSPAGRAFIRLYYAVSPGLVKHFGTTEGFNRFWKGILDRIVKKLQ